MRLPLLLLTVSILLIFSLSGCVPAKKQPPGSAYLEPSGVMRFNDVPYPTGFKLIPKESFILESGGLRAGVITYRGKADLQSVVLFYKSQMPIYNWALLNVLEYGHSMLNFEREKESCVVTVKPRLGGAEVTISLAPKSPIPPPKKKIPKKTEIQKPKVYEGKK